MTAFEVLMPVEGMAEIAERIEQRATLHRLWRAQNREATLEAIAPRIRADRRDLAHGASRRRVDAPPAESRDRREFRRRLRPYRRRLGGRARNHRHPHARRARRGRRRHRDGADARRGAAAAAGRALSSRGALAERALSAHRLAARTHDGHSGARAHRQGRSPGARRPSGSTSSITAARRRTTRPISIIPRF